MHNLIVKSFTGTTATISYGDEYHDKEVFVPEEYIRDGVLNVYAFLEYAAGFTPEPIHREVFSVFVGSNPNPRVTESLSRIGHYTIIRDPDAWADNILYDWNQNEQMIRYVEQHNMLFTMTRFLLHNKWVLNEAIRLINLDFTMTMSRESMSSPFPKIMYPKKIADVETFFGMMPAVIVKPFYGLQDDTRAFDRKTYTSQAEFLSDVIAHYGSLESFFAAQTPVDFVWSEHTKHTTPIMLQEWFDDTTSTTQTIRLFHTGQRIEYIDAVSDQATLLAIENFLLRTGTIRPSVITLKTIKDINGFVYIIDTSFAINNFLDLYDAELDRIISNVVVSSSLT